MTTKIEKGAGHAPTIENCATECNYDSQLYINNSSYIDKEFLELQQHPLVKDFANVSDDTYKLVAAVNPTLKLFFDVCKSIVEEGGHE